MQTVLENEDANRTAGAMMRANAESLRRRNRSLVLSAIRSEGPVAHTGISAWSGLSSATVSAITRELLDEGVLERRQKAASSARGRPRVLFSQKPEFAYVATARITADAVEFSLTDFCGTLKDRFEIRRDPASDASEFAKAFRKGMNRLCERSQMGPERLRVISITSKGLVARTRPVLLWSPVFGDGRIDFEAVLRPRFTGRISMTNETRFAAREIAARSGKDRLNAGEMRFAALSLDHSIGLGIAQIDERGEIESFAPPFGHMTHLPEGPLCRCGARGCVEAYAGFYGILRTAFEAPDDRIPAMFIPLSEMMKIADNARRGDRMAQYAFRLAGEALGIGLSRLFSFMGTMPVSLTGPGLNFLDLLSEGMERHLNSGLQARFDPPREFGLEWNEANLIYSGTVQASLNELDATIADERHKENSP